MTQSDRYSGTDNLEIMSEAVNYNRFLVDAIAAHAKPTDQLLDFGAGVGTFALELDRRGFQVKCVELDPDQAQTIRHQGLVACEHLEEIPDESVDLVYSLNVLEHIEDDVGALRELFAKLRPGGHALIYVPAFECLMSSMDEKVGHLRRYTREELRQKFSSAGFVATSDGYVDFLGFPATLLYKLIGRSDGGINMRALVFYDRFLFPLSRLLDLAFGRIAGKNVLAVGKKPDPRAAA